MIRYAQAKDEELTLLDENEVKLKDGTLVIASDDKAGNSKAVSYCRCIFGGLTFRCNSLKLS